MSETPAPLRRWNPATGEWQAAQTQAHTSMSHSLNPGGNAQGDQALDTTTPLLLTGWDRKADAGCPHAWPATGLKELNGTGDPSLPPGPQSRYHGQ
ncbi:hypothetical protein GCM10027294_52680 [Marinactinospora endophytica]